MHLKDKVCHMTEFHISGVMIPLFFTKLLEFVEVCRDLFCTSTTLFDSSRQMFVLICCV